MMDSDLFEMQGGHKRETPAVGRHRNSPRKRERRRMTDLEGAADNVALFGFSGYCDLLVPFTLDAGAFRGVMENLDTNKERDLGGTGVGVAIARAVETFKELESDARIIVLLTDGENNIDTISPRVAGLMAQELDIKVYTIFVGPTVARYPGGLIQRVQTRDLEQVAEDTGARFFHAEDATQLDEVYKEIFEQDQSFRKNQAA